MDGEIGLCMFKKLVKFLKLLKFIVIAIILIVFLWLLNRAGFIYYKVSESSVTLGVCDEVKGFTPPAILTKEQYESITNSINDSDIAIKDADELIKDARDRGILVD